MPAQQSQINLKKIQEMKLVTAAEMRELDRKAIEEFFIPGMVLMENAGQGTVNFMLEQLGSVTGKSALIFCGPGNNGGDGFVIARIIHQLGGFPCIYILPSPERLKGDALLNYTIVSKLELPIKNIDQKTDIAKLKNHIRNIHSQKSIWSIVDAIFGTGLTRNLSGFFQCTVDCINTLKKELHCPVTAVDISTGLDSDNGSVLGTCCNADFTATYGFAKPAHFMHGGPVTGKIRIVDIGIPPEAVKQLSLQGELLSSDICRLQKRRKTDSHKGSFGHLLILAGAVGKTGAAILSAQGALRSGIGLVTLAVAKNLNPIFETALTEAMTVPLPGSENLLSIDDYDLIMELSQNKNGVVLGPGIGTDPKTAALVVKLYTTMPLPMVIDADGLNILANNKKDLSNPSGIRIFTPHPGELGKLIGCTSKDIQNDRLHASKWLKDIVSQDQKHEMITVLKGAGTICCNLNGDWAINSTGNAGMATGGMGDVLSGVIGSFLSQGYSPWESARLGTYIHGLAADIIAQEKPWGYLASDVATMIPAAISQTFSHNTTLPGQFIRSQV